MNWTEAANGFSAMGSEARLQVLRLLIRAGADGLSVQDIQTSTGIPGSTLTHHLKYLVGAGVLTQTREGRTLRTRADFTRLRALADFILTECCADSAHRSAP